MRSAEAPGVCRSLLGSRLTAIERSGFTWLFRFADGISIATEALWRLLDDGGIVVTSEDHGARFGLPEPVDALKKVSALAVGATVTAVEVSPTTGDLSLEFSGQSHLQLQLLQPSSGYESWRLTVGGAEAICCGGGKITELPS